MYISPLSAGVMSSKDVSHHVERFKNIGTKYGRWNGHLGVLESPACALASTNLAGVTPEEFPT
jgi:hypothetical protein